MNLKNNPLTAPLRNLEEFSNDKPLPMPDLPRGVHVAADEYVSLPFFFNDLFIYLILQTWEDFLHLLKENSRLSDSWKIFDWQRKGRERKLNGFGTNGRNIFRSIANQIRSYHRSSYYCGDIYKCVSIMAADVSVKFPFVPITNKQRFYDGCILICYIFDI